VPTRSGALEGLTVTVATGTAVTVIVDEPLIPSLVALIVAVPGATPVTSPELLTTAIAGALLPQVTTRPLKGVPAPSRGVAVSCVVAPAGIEAEPGVTETDATATPVIVMVALPDFVSLVAVIVAVPAETAVTSPLLLTEATPDAFVPQVTSRPVRAFPPLSSGVAVS
jgi:hypothetical protein